MPLPPCVSSGPLQVVCDRDSGFRLRNATPSGAGLGSVLHGNKPAGRDADGLDRLAGRLVGQRWALHRRWAAEGSADSSPGRGAGCSCLGLWGSRVPLLWTPANNGSLHHQLGASGAGLLHPPDCRPPCDGRRPQQWCWRSPVRPRHAESHCNVPVFWILRHRHPGRPRPCLPLVPRAGRGHLWAVDRQPRGDYSLPDAAVHRAVLPPMGGLRGPSHGSPDNLRRRGG
mmetsp:Transcript_18939/g.52821  ORF Transcript_18939/g.52821 Transcript_18939/m.52821 type:complete len:228 (-) Transcript_18939:384-1067(-)